jgi:hypothetical protein
MMASGSAIVIPERSATKTATINLGMLKLRRDVD